MAKAQNTNETTETVETVKDVKPLSEYGDMLEMAITKVNSIAVQANEEQKFLKTRTGDESERIKSIAESADTDVLIGLRQQREKLMQAMSQLDAKILDAATEEFKTNKVYQPLSDDDRKSKQAKINELRDAHKAGLTSVQFLASMSLADAEIEQLVSDHVIQIERASRGLLSGAAPTSSTGSIKPRIQNLTVNGTKLETEDGKVNFTMVSSHLKNFSKKISGAELAQMVMDHYKVSEWSALPDTDINFQIPAPTTDDENATIDIRFDKR